MFYRSSYTVIRASQLRRKHTILDHDTTAQLRVFFSKATLLFYNDPTLSMLGENCPQSYTLQILRRAFVVEVILHPFALNAIAECQ